MLGERRRRRVHSPPHQGRIDFSTGVRVVVTGRSEDGLIEALEDPHLGELLRRRPVAPRGGARLGRGAALLGPRCCSRRGSGMAATAMREHERRGRRWPKMLADAGCWRNAPCTPVVRDQQDREVGERKRDDGEDDRVAR